eukprot:2796221-Pyramimonas_sp.AAC.1
MAYRYAFGGMCAWKAVSKTAICARNTVVNAALLDGEELELGVESGRGGVGRRREVGRESGAGADLCGLGVVVVIPGAQWRTSAARPRCTRCSRGCGGGPWGWPP